MPDDITHKVIDNYTDEKKLNLIKTKTIDNKT